MAGVVRKNVFKALADAEARGEKRVRVIIGLCSPHSLDRVNQALDRMGVKTVIRESHSFLAAMLSREEIQEVSRLKEHVKAVWLDRPVLARHR